MLPVLIPAFDESARVGSVVGGLPDRVAGRRVWPIVVDDGSSDGTGEAAKSAGATVVRMSANRGKGAALRRGMTELSGYAPEAVVWMDADGQHRPEDLPLLVGPVFAGQADMVVGTRYLRPSAVKAPLNRRLVRGATIIAIRRITGLRVTDPFSGFRAVSARALPVIRLVGDRYESELEAFFSLWREGYRVTEVPIPRLYGAGTSKMGARRGRFRGRVEVIRGYAGVILSQALQRELEAVGG